MHAQKNVAENLPIDLNRFCLNLFNQYVCLYDDEDD